jgi:hypothetical protein
VRKFPAIPSEQGILQKVPDTSLRIIGTRKNREITGFITGPITGVITGPVTGPVTGNAALFFGSQLTEKIGRFLIGNGFGNFSRSSAG